MGWCSQPKTWTTTRPVVSARPRSKGGSGTATVTQLTPTDCTSRGNTKAWLTVLTGKHGAATNTLYRPLPWWLNHCSSTVVEWFSCYFWPIRIDEIQREWSTSTVFISLWSVKLTLSCYVVSLMEIYAVFVLPWIGFKPCPVNSSFT